MEIRDREIGIAGRERLIKKLREDPVFFMIEVLGLKSLWSKQVEVVRAIRDNGRVTVRSGHAVGKSYISAAIVLWYLECWKDTIVITTAPTWKQVENVLWGEIRQMWRRSRVRLSGELMKTEIRIKDKHYAMGVSTDRGDRIQGFHSENVVVVVDEAAGVEEVMYESIEGLLTNDRCKILLIGNPVVRRGTFWESFRRVGWAKVHMSCLDSPNVRQGREVIKGLVGRRWVEEKLEQWGEDSGIYRSRVLGEFPLEGEDVLIPLERVERAEAREVVLSGYEVGVMAIDVARFGSNDTVYMYRRGDRVMDVRSHQGQDGAVTIGRGLELIREWEPDIVVVDDVGVGGVVRDVIGRSVDNVYGFEGGGKASDERFLNMRAEWYWKLAEKFRRDRISLVCGTRLGAELSLIRKDYSGSGSKIQIMDKGRIVKDSGGQFQSTDYADALMMTEWGLSLAGGYESGRVLAPRRSLIHNGVIYGGMGLSSSVGKSNNSRTGYG